MSFKHMQKDTNIAISTEEQLNHYWDHQDDRIYSSSHAYGFFKSPVHWKDKIPPKMWIHGTMLYIL